MSVNIYIQFSGRQLTIPINPEKLSISRDADNTKLDIIEMGKAIRKGEPGLKSITIESFFPAPNSYFYKGVNPKTCIDFIDEIWKTENINNNVAKIVTTGLPINLNMYFVINNFEYDHKAGEEEDIYYNLEITEYKPYGVKTVDVDLSGLAASRAMSVAQPAPPPVATPKTYTVVRGDSLWKITKQFTGNGAGWRALYDLNKGVIGGNPNLIYPNQVLILPTGW